MDATRRVDHKTSWCSHCIAYIKLSKWPKRWHRTESHSNDYAVVISIVLVHRVILLACWTLELALAFALVDCCSWQFDLDATILGLVFQLMYTLQLVFLYPLHAI